MFNNDPTHIRRIVNEHQNDEYRRAARIRLIREVSGARAPFYTPLIISLGKRMVAWGSRMQAQVNDINTINEFVPTKYDTATMRKSA